ncbi:hypothetical protein J1614_001461 [Plenodomus biglobosus]|nr:hypothetical protein J1614_001461 [Plenodomus biglobosus]
MSTSASTSAARRTAKYMGTLVKAEAAASLAPAVGRGGNVEPCKVSMACQNEMRKKFSNPQKYVDLGCSHDPRYFPCLCSRTNSLGANPYFDAHCLFTQCGDDGNKIDSRCTFADDVANEVIAAFILAYREACNQAKKQLIDIPDEWTPFALLLQSESPPLSAFSTSAVATNTATSIMSATSTGAKTTSATSQMASMSSSTVTTTRLEEPSSSSDAGFQFPICNIEPKCMRNRGNTPTCNDQDFKCICLVSNSMANNTQFDQQCVLDDCTGDIAKEEFMDYLTFQCSLANKTLTDIPKQWEPYLPSFYKTSSATPSLPTASGIVAPLPPPYSRPEPLSDGAKAGVGIGVLATLVIFVALVITFYRAKKKVKQVQKRNAELVDRQSAHGVSAYIRNLTGKSSISLPMTEGGTTMIGEPQLVLSPVMLEPKVPWSEHPTEVQRQYSESDYGDEITPIGNARGGGVWDDGGVGQSGASGYAAHIQKGRQGVYPQR